MYIYIRREDLSIFIPHAFEYIFFEVQANQNKPIIVGVIDRPNSPPLADLDLLMSKILTIHKISNAWIII